MLAPNYHGKTTPLKKREVRQYKHQLIKWVKQYIKDVTTYNTQAETEKVSHKVVRYTPRLFWDEASDQFLSKGNTDYSGKPVYCTSELMALNFYYTYTQKGMSEREIFKDFLYAKEQHINKVATREFRKHPPWWVHKKRKD